MFASPERNLLFDLNDFDETLPGPFEYDVKRMSASFTIAARNNGFTKAEARDATLASVSAYRTTMAEFAEMGTMDIWYAHLSEQQLMAAIESFAAQQEKGKKQKKAAKEEAKAARKAAAEGSHPRQPAGAVEARRARGRPVPDRQPAADRRPGARLRSDLRHVAR